MARSKSANPFNHPPPNLRGALRGTKQVHVPVQPMGMPPPDQVVLRPSGLKIGQGPGIPGHGKGRMPGC